MAITKCHTLGGLKTEVYFSQFWTGKSKMKIPANTVLIESSLSGLHMATFLLCTHMAFPWFMNVERGDLFLPLLIGPLIPS